MFASFAAVFRKIATLRTLHANVECKAVLAIVVQVKCHFEYNEAVIPRVQITTATVLPKTIAGTC